MSVLFEEVEKQTKLLSVQDKARLARILVEELDPLTDGEVEQSWILEAEQRYSGYLNGTVESHSGDEVMTRVRSRLA